MITIQQSVAPEDVVDVNDGEDVFLGPWEPDANSTTLRAHVKVDGRSAMAVIEEADMLALKGPTLMRKRVYEAFREAVVYLRVRCYVETHQAA